MSGQWHGTFDYPGNYAPSTPFLLNLREAGGALSGEIIEPEQFHGTLQTISAVVQGWRSGRSVDFSKLYLGRLEGYEDPVDYVGQLSQDGLSVTGVWSLPDADGTFEMHRDVEVSAVALVREAAVD